MSRTQEAVLALACVVFAALCASRLAEPATLIAVDAVMAMKTVGFTAAIVVQIARDLSVLGMVALIGGALAPVHRMSILAFSALAATILAVAEPIFAARVDTVAAAWQSFRVVGRLSALTFALTFASYQDAFSERPRGHLRALLRFSITLLFVALAQAIAAVSGKRGQPLVIAALARAVGLTVVLDDTEAPEDWRAAPGFRAEARTVFERLAVATILSDPPPLRSVLREPVLSVGSEPLTTLRARREPTKNAAFDAFMPARIDIEPG